MKNRESAEKKALRHNLQKRHTDCLRHICWIIIPIIVLVLILLDALGIYSFNKERLIVLGIGLLIVLLPFINEIKLKDFSFKRNDKDDTSSY